MCCSEVIHEGRPTTPQTTQTTPRLDSSDDPTPREGRTTLVPTVGTGGSEGGTWEPGDPLHTNPRRQHQSGLFNFRTDPEAENCICPDRAQWPTPLLGSAVKGEDELDAFIREWREWRRTLEEAS